jgi:hypothetical protein
MHIPVSRKLQPPACQPLAAMRVRLLQASAGRANVRGLAQPVLLPTDTAEVEEVRRVVDALAEGAMTVTTPFTRTVDIDRAQAVSIGDIAIERGFVLKKTGPELVGPCPHCGRHDQPARPMARSAAVTGAVMKRVIRRLNITSNDTGQERSTKYERLGELLRKYGLDLINSEQFWAEMKRQGFGQADIDEWCDEYHRKTGAEQ